MELDSNRVTVRSSASGNPKYRFPENFATNDCDKTRAGGSMPSMRPYHKKKLELEQQAIATSLYMFLNPMQPKATSAS